jgi:hypothetical protein
MAYFHNFRKGGCGLQFHHFCGLETLGSFCYGEFDSVSLVQRTEALGFYCGVMNEYVIAGSTADETISLFIVEPFYCALFFHFPSLKFLELLLNRIAMFGATPGSGRETPYSSESANGMLHKLGKHLIELPGIYALEKNNSSVL